MTTKSLPYLALLLSVLLPPAGIILGLISLHDSPNCHISQTAILTGTIIMTAILISLLL